MLAQTLPMNAMRDVLGVSLCLIALLFALPAQADGPVVKLDGGRIRGVAADGVERFAGVPYAAAPIGDLRWSSPTKAPGWTGVRDGTRMGNRCPQTASGDTPRSETEDCLVLNIYRPDRPSSNARAVLVYIHGGGATSGAAMDHDGSELARDGDIVVVTVNYRLGVLGFMTLPSGANSKGKASGNYGVEDVAFALRWVARNIGRVGGDPAKVTLAGESAGGTVICPVIGDAANAGLFRAAILSSDDCLHDVDDLATAQARGVTLAAKLNCNLPGALACLRGKSSGAILDAGGFAAPHIGGEGAPRMRTFDLAAAGQWPAAPLMLGFNKDEGRISGLAFTSFDAGAYQAWLERLVGVEQARHVAERYPFPASGEPFAAAYVISQIITDSGMRGFGGCSMLALAQNVGRATPTYVYRFEDPEPPMWRGPPGWRSGAAHGAELAYLWPGGGFSNQSRRFNPNQTALSKAMIQRWAAFVKTQSPNLAGAPNWPSLGVGGAYWAFDPADGGHLSATRQLSQDHQCEFWASMPWILDRGEPVQSGR